VRLVGVRTIPVITNRELGIENLDAKYLAEDLIENEPELFD
jgi:hypothetical protein